MTVGVFVAIIGAVVFCLTGYALLHAASRADDDLDRAYRDWLDDLRAGRR